MAWILFRNITVNAVQKMNRAVGEGMGCRLEEEGTGWGGGRCRGCEGDGGGRILNTGRQLLMQSFS